MATDVRVGSLWKRRPPGREVVRVERVWNGPEGVTLRCQPIRGGRPLVTSPEYLDTAYEEVSRGE